MSTVYVGLGSNVGDREEQVLRAVHEMRAFAHINKISTLGESVALDATGQPAPHQPKYINAVVEIDTDFSPQEVLAELLRIEREMGRVRRGKADPREIDLDIIAFDDVHLIEDNLEIPHPEMHNRRFVLEPFMELLPTWVHPKLNKSIKDLLQTLPDCS